jgi:hypothetical protein
MADDDDDDDERFFCEAVCNFSCHAPRNAEFTRDRCTERQENNGNVA